MLTALLVAMGTCGSRSEMEPCGCTSERKKQERQAAAEQRRLLVGASDTVLLLSTYPVFELAAHEANTVLEVLEIRAGEIGLPKAAAAWLKLGFSGVIVWHDKTLKEAGIFDRSEISVQGEDEARAKTEQAGKTDIHKVLGFDEVQLVLAFYPERVDATGRGGKTPLMLAAATNRCKVAEILLAAKANVNATAKDGTTSLERAVSNNHCEVAQILIAAKADVNHTNNGKETALKRESGKVGFQPNMSISSVSISTTSHSLN